MDYREHAPPSALARALACIWTFEDDAACAEPQRVVPDGRCELLVHFGAPYREADSDAPQARVVFAGQLTRPLWLHATGPCGVVAARFDCAAARAFLGMPMDRATDRRLALAGLWPEAIRALEGDVLAAPSMQARVDAIARFVGQRLEGTGPDAAIERGVAAMQQASAEISVEEIAAAAGMSRRQLERRFRDAVGIPPGTLADILRFRRVFDAMERDSARPWTDAAAAAGYFDQSHLIRDFRRFVGCTPGEFLAARPGLATALVE
jgi:AraC-like DNA-binding protein